MKKLIALLLLLSSVPAHAAGTQGIVGPRPYSKGSIADTRMDTTGATVMTEAHGRYQEAALNGTLYFMSIAAGAPTAYVGAAGGTPLLAVHNPANSKYNLVLVEVCIANRVAASAAGTVSFGVWAGPSVMPTGTQTNPTNAYTLAATGSAGKGFSNAALTGSTALGFIFSPATYYWATAAGAVSIPGCYEMNGVLPIAPGNQMAIGATSALTSATWDVTWFWEEVPL